MPDDDLDDADDKGPASDPVLDKAKKLAFADGPCWLWDGVRHGQGYGVMSDGRGPVLAHRKIYELLVGPIPDGMQLDHKCRQRGCVNPAHLRVVTNQQNATAPGSKTGAHFKNRMHCPKGHPYSPDNTYQWAGGGRVCKTCKSEGAKALRARRREERASA